VSEKRACTIADSTTVGSLSLSGWPCTDPTENPTLRTSIFRERWRASRLPSILRRFAALTRAMRSRLSGHLSERRASVVEDRRRGQIPGTMAIRVRSGCTGPWTGAPLPWSTCDTLRATCTTESHGSRRQQRIVRRCRRAG
jgi:hypothetical protein